MKNILNFINGEYVASARQFDKNSPLTGAAIASVHEADKAQVDAAVSAARAAKSWASATAWRSEPAPLLLRLVTVKVAAPAGRLIIANKINRINGMGGVTDGAAWRFLWSKDVG